MFQVKEIVKPSGKGRTKDWPKNLGVVTRVTQDSVFVQWQNCAVEDDLKFDEVISTGAFAEKVPNVVAELPPPKKKLPTIH